MKFFFSAINLGCSKNLVDLEYAVGQILGSANSENDVRFFDVPEDKNVQFIIINTCGFLSSSRDEAESTIRHYDNLGKKIILMGCYIPVRDDDFLKSLKNLYKIIPQKESENINKELFGQDEKAFLKQKVQSFKETKLKEYLQNLDRLETDKKAFIWSSKSTRLPFNSPYGHEFVKIAEGCNNRCSFCIIPKIRGDQKSRPIEDVVEEIKTLVGMGVKEIEIISQDTTRYGVDIYAEPKLFELLEEIEKIPLDFKYRIFYLYPDILTFEHLKKLKTFTKFIPYFDLPIQHISPNILKRMGRFYDDKHIFDLFDFIKENFANAFLHTNFIIGFPWESQEDFEMLIDFSKKYQFDSVSMFGYHDEPLAASSKLDKKIDDMIIKQRVTEMSQVLEKMYADKTLSRKGKKLWGYVYDFYDNIAHIRWEMFAPEIDELDRVPIKNVVSKNIEIGAIVEYVL